MQLPPGPGDHLPVARYRDRILCCVEQHATLILLGETGSGKTTQVRTELIGREALPWSCASCRVETIEREEP